MLEVLELERLVARFACFCEKLMLLRRSCFLGVILSQLSSLLLPIVAKSLETSGLPSSSSEDSDELEVVESAVALVSDELASSFSIADMSWFVASIELARIKSDGKQELASAS